MQDPGDDVVSCLLRGDPELPPLDDDTLVGIVMMFISAGHNTTTSAIGNAVLRLARDTQLQSRLRAHPELIPAFAEEVVRIDAPQQAMRRIAVTDTELGGRQIAAGDFVWLVFGSANLDPGAIERRLHEARSGADAQPARRLRPRDPPVHRRAARPSRAPGGARGTARAHVVVRGRRRRDPSRLAAARRRQAAATPVRIVSDREVFTLSGGLRLSYVTWGEPGAPDLLLVHGGGLDATDWRAVAPELAAAGYRVTAPDLRGCGESDWDPDVRYMASRTS